MFCVFITDADTDLKPLLCKRTAAASCRPNLLPLEKRNQTLGCIMSVFSDFVCVCIQLLL